MFRFSLGNLIAVITVLAISLIAVRELIFPIYSNNQFHEDAQSLSEIGGCFSDIREERAYIRISEPHIVIFFARHWNAPKIFDEAFLRELQRILDNHPTVKEVNFDDQVVPTEIISKLRDNNPKVKFTGVTAAS